MNKMLPLAKKLLMELDHLAPNDRKFASDIANRCIDGTSSLKQDAWIERLLERAEQNKRNPQQEIEINVQRIVEMFDSASAHIKYPKVRLLTDDGRRVQLNKAGAASKYAGQINVTDGGPFGDNEWYGRVDLQGHVTLSRNEYNGRRDEALAAVQRFAANPEEQATLYGRRTSNCCFCGRELTDERSTDVGYGPICADRYGLAWG